MKQQQEVEGDPAADYQMNMYRDGTANAMD